MKLKPLILLALVVINIFFITFYFIITSQKHNKITFLNVGQGSGVLIQTKTGENILIDVGNEKVSVKSLTQQLGFFDRNIDSVFITHYDLDHVGLLPFYIKNYQVKKVLDTGVTNIGDSQLPLYNAINLELLKKSIKKYDIKSGDKIYISNDISINVLFPGKFLDVNKLRSNSGSMVLQVNIENFKILITGDLPEKFEKVLVQRYGNKLKSDILVAGHHGSKTSSNETFLQTVSPKYFVVSSGKDNSYGHPNKEVLERAIKLNSKVLRTDILGNIRFKVDENKNLILEI
jgi:competence protein ComEC